MRAAALGLQERRWDTTARVLKGIVVTNTCGWLGLLPLARVPPQGAADLSLYLTNRLENHVIDVKCTTPSTSKVWRRSIEYERRKRRRKGEGEDWRATQQGRVRHSSFWAPHPLCVSIPVGRAAPCTATQRPAKRICFVDEAGGVIEGERAVGSETGETSHMVILLWSG